MYPPCDGRGPHSDPLETRILPTSRPQPSGQTNVNICRACFERDMQVRKAYNDELGYPSVQEFEWDELERARE